MSNIFLTKINQNTSHINDVFAFIETAYSFRKSSSLKRGKIRTTKHDLQSVSNIALKLWEKLPNSVRNASSLPLFKYGLSNISCIQCSCRLCVTYIYNLGCINLFISYYYFLILLFIIYFLFYESRLTYFKILFL